MSSSTLPSCSRTVAAAQVWRREGAQPGQGGLASRPARVRRRPTVEPGKAVGTGQPMEVLATHVRAARMAVGQLERHSAGMGHETRVNRAAAPGPR
jgi:hypothetical protein